MTKKQKLAVVKRTRELLARPKGWSKGAYWNRIKPSARTTYGLSPVRNVHMPADEFSFCLAGAAKRAHIEIMGNDGTSEWELVKCLSLEALAAAKNAEKGYKRQDGDGEVFTFNDRSRTTKQDVLALLDEKIAELS